MSGPFQVAMRREPFWMLVGCVLVNRTKWNGSADAAHAAIRERWRDPAALAAADAAQVEEVLRPLGLSTARSRNLVAMAGAWENGERDVARLPGCGKYAADSYAIFVDGRRDVEPTDRVLRSHLSRLVDAPPGAILIEGADGSGKSTLAAAFRDLHGARYMHSRVWKDCARWHRGIVRRTEKLVEAGQLVCLDRLWPSEMVYGPIFRGACYADAVAEELDSALRGMGCVHVLCVPSDVRGHLARFEELKARGREAFDRVESVIQAYADLLHGNIARPGNNYFDRFCRFGDFGAGRRVVQYDIDSDGRDVEGFAALVVAALRVAS